MCTLALCSFCVVMFVSPGEWRGCLFTEMIGDAWEPQSPPKTARSYNDDRYSGGSPERQHEITFKWV